ncbi:protein kinase, partial [Trypanosoma grayi]|uniref:protein kinase n=1 Tax=Trypanosoma grayi TaxID=71804 RepID=UPI0004F4AAC7
MLFPEEDGPPGSVPAAASTEPEKTPGAERRGKTRRKGSGKGRNPLRVVQSAGVVKAKHFDGANSHSQVDAAPAACTTVPPLASRQQGCNKAPFPTGSDGLVADSSASQQHGCRDEPKRELPTPPPPTGNSSRTIAKHDESACSGAHGLGEAARHETTPDGSRAEGALTVAMHAVSSRREEPCECRCGETEKVLNGSESTGLNGASLDAQVAPPEPSPRLDVPPSPAVYSPHLKDASSHSGRVYSFSLRCWVLCPLVAILVAVSIMTMILSIAAARTSSRVALATLHSVIFANMETAVGRMTLSKMVRMATSTGSMYFSNNTFPNPVTDKLMPLENGM